MSQIETHTTIVVQSDYKGKKSSEKGRECVSSTEMQWHNTCSAWTGKKKHSQTECCGCLLYGFKKLPALQIFYFCFSSWAAILSVLKANPEAFKWKPLINSFLTMLVPSLNIHHGNFVAGGPITLTKSSTSSGYARWFCFLV